jgi:two-component system chemotaxis response regulator CheY
MLIRKKISQEHNAKRFELVGEAANGFQAMKMFKELRPDVVTMDLTMPHIDGIECISRMMKIDPEVKILVISALSDRRTGLEALEKGAKGFINKPFSSKQLDEALEILVKEY